MPNSNLYALLIGINCYIPNRLPDGTSYRNLAGSVRDINHVTDFLKLKLKVPDNQIFTLTATGELEPSEPPDKLPTYENMVAMFAHLTQIAQSGDQIYIHYSGHGGRAQTNYPQLKGEKSIDETLVPYDIGKPTARYLRDIELAKLLEKMVDKGLIVTVILDSCHSGGATRGDDCDVRGLDTIDTTVRPIESLVATEAELTQTWEALTTSETRNVTLGSGWLPQPQGYVLLAACRQNESAVEYAFDGKERNGALTYWLLDCLNSLQPGLTYKLLHDRILAKINSQFQSQTPQLQGEASRFVFGSDGQSPAFGDRTSLEYAVNVMKVEANQRLLINAGQVQGVREGTQFAIYPHGTTDFTSIEQRLAVAEITQLGATESWCDITEIFSEEAIEQGSQALLINPKSVKLVQKVRLFPKAVNLTSPSAPLSLPRRGEGGEVDSKSQNELSPQAPPLSLPRRGEGGEVDSKSQNELPPQAPPFSLPRRGEGGEVDSKSENELPPEVDQIQHQALQAISNEITTAQGWIELVSADENADYQICLNNNSEYEICDPSGTAIKNIRPAVKFNDADAAITVVKRLMHLAKYRAVQQLDNYYHKSNVPGHKLAFTVELAGKQANYDPTEKPEPQPISHPGNTPEINVGEWIFIRIRNDSSQSLNVTVLALQADWSIKQIYPDGGGNFITFDPGQEELLPLQANLPDGYQQAQDIIKVFATVGATDFHWLELPALDQPAASRGSRSAGNPLEEILSAIAAEQPPTRNLQPVRYAAAEWITEQVVVRTI